jgi:arsenite methyltransferase
MPDMTQLPEHQRRIAAVYNLASEGYDKPALRFFSLVAQRLVDLVEMPTVGVVLDAATGTGTAAIAAARKVGPSGRVIGVDIATHMLSRAHQKARNAGMTNVTIQEGDIEDLEFDADTFDTVMSASAIFLLTDLSAALREWRRVVRPGGWLAFSSYGKSAFEPMSGLYEARIRSYGVPLAAPTPFSWQRLNDPEAASQLLRDAGLRNIRVYSEQLGYTLRTVDEWWDIVWNSGFRGPISQLPESQLERFRFEHLAEVAAKFDTHGLGLDVPGIFALGQKAPARS